MSMGTAYYQGIYQRAFERTGSAARAAEAVSIAEAALNAVFHEAVVRSGGDEAAGRALEARLAEPLGRLAQEMALARSSELDVDARGAALREMMGIMERDLGYAGGRAGLHGWLRANVLDDGVLRAAGFDVRAVRTLPRPEGWPDDLEALMALLRDQLQLVQRMSGGRLTDAEIQAQLDVVRASAHRFGYEVPAPTTTRTVDGAGPAPEGSIPAADLVPRRV